MARKSTPKSGDLIALRSRLGAVRDVQLGALSDDEVLTFLAERKQLETRICELEAQKAKEQHKAALKRSYRENESSLASINQQIIPGKSDEELLSLIAERKKTEGKLEELSRELVALEQELPATEASPALTPKRSTPEPTETQETTIDPEVPRKRRTPPVGEKKTDDLPMVSVSGEEEDVDKTPPHTPSRADSEFGVEGIAQGVMEEPSAFEEYYEQIKSQPASIGAILQDMPPEAKKNKALMLKIAAIDPAYVMHYADSGTLKKDEDFNIRVAGIKNQRNSGNALAEMLPESRTEKVILVGVQQDFRNIRFASPSMDGYDRMLEIAKQGALEKIRELGQGVSPETLIPKALQKDKQFMQAVEQVLTAQDSSGVVSQSDQPSQYTPKSPWSIRHSGL